MHFLVSDRGSKIVMFNNQSYINYLQLNLHNIKDKRKLIMY